MLKVLCATVSQILQAQLSAHRIECNRIMSNDGKVTDLNLESDMTHHGNAQINVYLHVF